jgi:hypothetical protein
MVNALKMMVKIPIPEIPCREIRAEINPINAEAIAGVQNIR